MARLQSTIPDEHFEALLASARAHDRSIAAEARRAIRWYLRELAAQPIVQTPSQLASQSLASRVVEHSPTVR